MHNDDDGPDSTHLARCETCRDHLCTEGCRRGSCDPAPGYVNVDGHMFCPGECADEARRVDVEDRARADLRATDSTGPRQEVAAP